MPAIFTDHAAKRWMRRIAPRIQTEKRPEDIVAASHEPTLKQARRIEKNYWMLGRKRDLDEPDRGGAEFYVSEDLRGLGPVVFLVKTENKRRVVLTCFPLDPMHQCDVEKE